MYLTCGGVIKFCIRGRSCECKFSGRYLHLNLFWSGIERIRRIRYNTPVTEALRVAYIYWAWTLSRCEVNGIVNVSNITSIWRILRPDPPDPPAKTGSHHVYCIRNWAYSRTRIAESSVILCNVLNARRSTSHTILGDFWVWRVDCIPVQLAILRFM